MKDFNYDKAEITGLPPQFFETNRKNYLENLKKNFKDLEPNSILLLKGGALIPRYDADLEYYYFIQESNFYYLTGVLEDGYYAYIDLSDGSLVLFAPMPDETSKIFFAHLTLDMIKEKYKAKEVFDLQDMSQKISELNVKKMYILNGVNSDSDLKITSFDFVFPEPYKKLNELIDNNGLIYETLAETRTVKNQDEIDLICHLEKHTIDAHINTVKSIKPGIYERDLENTFWSYLITRIYCRNHPYQHICGAGVHGATLHYIVNDTKLEDGQLILLDMGGKLCGYSSDITETVPVNGKFTEKQKEIYNIVLKVNRTVINTVKEGTQWSEMHLLAEKIIIEGLVKLGLIKSEFAIDDMVNDGLGFYFMPHGLGHFIGIDTHDVGGYLSYNPKRINRPGLSSLRTNRFLKEGNIITVEPGIYFVKFLLEKGFKDEKVGKYFNVDKVKEYFDFGGVRIEDDVLIQKNGSINLTKDMPRTIEEIENLMKK